MINPKVLEVLAAFSKVPQAELQAKFKTETGENLGDDELADALKGVISSRLETFKDDVGKEVKRKTLTALEKELKQKFSIEGTETGVELVAKIVEVETTKAKANPENIDFSKWTETKWSELQPFREALKKIAKTHEEKVEHAQKELIDYKNLEQVRSHEKAVFEYVETKLKDMNPNGLQDPTKSKYKISDFIARNFEANKFRFEDGVLYQLDGDGNVAKKGKEELYDPIKAEDVITEKWYDGFNKVPPQNNPPNPSGGGQSGSNNGSGLGNDQKQKLDSFAKAKDTSAYVTFVRTLQGANKDAAMKYWRDISS